MEGQAILYHGYARPPKGADDDCARTTAAEDDRDQSAVLRRVLEVHPTELTEDELIREMNGGRPREFDEMDGVQRAIRELAGTGLLQRERFGLNL